MAHEIRTRMPPMLVTSNKSSRKSARCGAFEISFSKYPTAGSGGGGSPNGAGVKLLFSKISGNPFPHPSDVVASIAGLVLPKRLSFPGGESFMSNQGMTKNVPPSPGGGSGGPLDQRPVINITIKSGYFDR